MESIGEKISYLKGLAEGLKVDESSNEGRIIKGILDVLSEMNLYFEDIEDEIDATLDSVDEISEDLSDLEDEVYGAFDDECDGECDCCDGCDDEECAEDIYEIECPSCGELVYADGETIENDDIYCPNCKKIIEVEIPDAEEDDE